MPNTLAHYGIQAIGSRIGLPRLDVRWLLLAPVLPDIPWIAQRVHMTIGPVLNPYDVRLYAMIQASLFFCLLLSGPLALLSARPRLMFGVLAANSLAHLLLDAVEIKWANGVHLLAPFSWKLFSGGLVWPENAAILAVTGLGFAAGLWFCFAAPGTPIGFRILPHRPAFAALLLGCYFAAPLLFLRTAERSNSHYVATLRETGMRTGRPLELDRAVVIRDDSGARVRTFAREWLRIANPEVVRSGTYSIQGRFLDPATLHLDRVHRHATMLRQAPTYAGLFLLAIVWIIPGLRTASQPASTGKPEADLPA